MSHPPSQLQGGQYMPNGRPRPGAPSSAPGAPSFQSQPRYIDYGNPRAYDTSVRPASGLTAARFAPGSDPAARPGPAAVGLVHADPAGAGGLAGGHEASRSEHRGLDRGGRPRVQPAVRPGLVLSRVRADRELEPGVVAGHRLPRPALAGGHLLDHAAGRPLGPPAPAAADHRGVLGSSDRGLLQLLAEHVELAAGLHRDRQRGGRELRRSR